MTEDIDDDTVPKEIPSFAGTLFVKQSGGGFTTALTATKPAKISAAISTEAKGKKTGNESSKKEMQAIQ